MYLKSNEYKIIDNFLPEDEFKHISSLLFSNNFPYFYNPAVSYKEEGIEDDHFIFYHILLDDDVGVNSNYFNLFHNTFFTKIQANDFRRCRVNNYTRYCEKFTHKFHTDRNYNHNVALWYANTCNGPTILKIDNKEVVIKAKENRMVLFNGEIEHAPVSQTDTKLRINVNINYI